MSNEVATITGVTGTGSHFKIKILSDDQFMEVQLQIEAIRIFEGKILAHTVKGIGKITDVDVKECYDDIWVPTKKNYPHGS